MAVMIIIVILLVGMGTAYVKNVKKANRDQTVNELSVFATSFGDAYYDLGSPTFDPVTEAEDFKSFLNTLQSNYVGCAFDLDNIRPTSNGFSVELTSPLSVYESRYRAWFTTKEGSQSLIMVSCSGEDGIFQDASYGTQDYGDDLVLVVKPKG